MRPGELDELQMAIKRLHGCGSRHVRSVEVNEVFRGKTVWQGVVESFDLVGHPKAQKAYAWMHPSGEDDSKTRCVAVLAIPPVKTARDAVRVAIAAEAEAKWEPSADPLKDPAGYMEELFSHGAEQAAKKHKGKEPGK